MERKDTAAPEADEAVSVKQAATTAVVSLFPRARDREKLITYEHSDHPDSHDGRPHADSPDEEVENGRENRRQGLGHGLSPEQLAYKLGEVLGSHNSEKEGESEKKGESEKEAEPVGR